MNHIARDLSEREVLAGKSVSTEQSQIELRTGKPYAQLIDMHLRFAVAVAEHLGVSVDSVIPAFGTTGAIESVRNYISLVSRRRHPIVLTVSPGYWRAREAFLGFDFEVVTLNTEPFDFSVDEDSLIARANDVRPDVVYLSLPNNPTGAIFDPVKIIDGMPRATKIIVDLTLPSLELDTQALTSSLFERFSGRPGIFFVGSTSKSHATAEYRIGWAVCTSTNDATNLRAQNRNVVSSIAADVAIRQLQTRQTVIQRICDCFQVLRAAESKDTFELIRPQRRAETGYALIKVHGPLRLREILAEFQIKVMWGSEFGLTDEYIRLETSEPANIKKFIAVLSTAKSVEPEALHPTA